MGDAVAAYGPLGGPVWVDVVVVFPVGLTATDWVTVTDGMRERIGPVIVSTMVLAGLWLVYLWPVIIPALNVKVSSGLVKKSR